MRLRSFCFAEKLRTDFRCLQGSYNVQPQIENIQTRDISTMERRPGHPEYFKRLINQRNYGGTRMLPLNPNDRIALVSCSNGQPKANEDLLKKLQDTLEQLGLQPVWGRYIFETEHGLNGDARDKAAELCGW